VKLRRGWEVGNLWFIWSRIKKGRVQRVTLRLCESTKAALPLPLCHSTMPSCVRKSQKASVIHAWVEGSCNMPTYWKSEREGRGKGKKNKKIVRKGSSNTASQVTFKAQKLGQRKIKANYRKARIPARTFAGSPNCCCETHIRISMA
jgi:hypothetical protein